jgi:uncharacterized protein with PIN domain
MECPKCSYEIDEDLEHEDAEYAKEFEVVCGCCEEVFWVEAFVSYTYRIMGGEGEVSDGESS